MSTPCKSKKKEVIPDQTEDTCTIFYKTGDKYEITITPCDKYQFNNEPARTARFIECIVQKCYNTLAESTEYSLILEYSEPRHSNFKIGIFPRLHLHGFIKITNCIKFLECGLSKLMQWSDYQINLFDRPDYWATYLKKQREEWDIYFKTAPKGLPYEITHNVSKIKKKSSKIMYKQGGFQPEPVSDSEEYSL